MKRVLAAAVAAAFAVAVLAAPGSAATPNQRIAKLERLVKKQQKDFAAQKKQIAALKKQATETEEVIGAVLLFSVCSTAITADAFMSTWGTINSAHGGALIGTQTPVTEPGCNRLQVPRTQTSPPTLNAFAALMRFVNSPFSAFSTVFR